MKLFRKGISFLLALTMVLGMIPPLAVHAEETQPTETVAVEEPTVPTTEAVVVAEETAPAETTVPATEPTEAEEETTAPTEGTTAPTEVTEPTETVTEPTQGDTTPTEPVTEPSEETTAPTEAVTEPAEETLEPEDTVGTATEPYLVASGSCGYNVRWELGSEGTLMIFGNGRMQSYWFDPYGSNYAPWYDYRNQIQTIIVSSGVINIGSMAFSDCRNATSITIPDSVTVIGSEAFKYCRSITNIEIPDSVTNIGYGAFEGCSGLTSIEIPNSVTTMGNRMFTSCKALVNIVLPDSMISIGEFTFSGCAALKNIIIPQDVTSIENKAFYGCSSLTSIDIHEKVTTIGEYAFGECSGLTTISFPDSVTSVGSGAFYSCNNLTDVKLSNGLNTIAQSMFNKCSNLSEITIPNEVTLIDRMAFYECRKLTTITIPVSVSRVETSAFEYCTELKTVQYLGTQEEWELLKSNVANKNECLLRANILCNWREPARLANVHYYASWRARSAYLIGSDGGTEYATSSGVTDSEFLAAPETYLGTYVIPVFVETDNGCILEDLIPIASKSGIVEYADWDVMIINGEQLRVPVDLAAPNSYQGKYVVYQSIDGDLAGIAVLDIVDYLDNSDISICYAGSAFAYYQYISGPSRNVTYKVGETEGTVPTNEKGVFQVPLGSFSTVGETSVSVWITKVGNIVLNPAMELKPVVKVTPLEFTQKWQVNFGASVGAEFTEGAKLDVSIIKAEATIASVGASAGASVGWDLKRSYSSQNGETLEMTSNQTIEVGTELKSGITGGTLISDCNLIEASSGLDTSGTVTDGIRIDNYSEENTAHSRAIGTFLLSQVVRANPCSIILKKPLEKLEKQVYSHEDIVVIEGSGAGISGSLSAEIITANVDDVNLFSLLGGEGALSFSCEVKKESDGTCEKTVNYKSETNLSALNFSADINDSQIDLGQQSMLAVDILGKDTEIKSINSEDGDAIEMTYLSAKEAGIGSLMLNSIYTSEYHQYRFEEDALQHLENKEHVYKEYNSGARSALSLMDVKRIAKLVSESDVPIPYKALAKNQGVFSLPLSLGAALGFGVDIGVHLSYLSGTEYATATGTAMDDTLLITSETKGISNKVNGYLWNLDEKILEFLVDIEEEIKKEFEEVCGDIKEGVATGWAWVSDKADSVCDWTVTLFTPKSESERHAWSTSYSIQNTSQYYEPAEGAGFDGAGNYKKSKAATVGRPFIINVTDNTTGEAVTDLSSEPLEFTIRYAEEDLTAAGLRKDSPIVRGGGIAMYRYSDNGDYFEYVGGTNDLEAMTVTAEITRPGQYVLAVDACAPALSYLDISDFRQTPTITAYIDDLTGLNADSFSFRLDGVEKVNGSSLSGHYNAAAGIFTYQISEAEKLAEGEHTLSFTLADTSGNAQTYEYSFQVDLTAPEITEVTVNGATNEGSAVEIRAQVSDPNLTAVYAVLSKRLADGTWSEEVATAMGDMGEGLWGLDYEGDGSTIRIAVKAVDIAENETTSANYEAYPFVEGITLSQEYIALQAGQSCQLTAEVQPAELVNSLQWSLEEGSEGIVAVDDEGNVTGLAEGTAYVLAAVTDGETELSARCRIDVTAAIEIENIQLSTTKLTTELFKTDYAAFEILLDLPQNRPATSTYSLRDGNAGVSVVGAEFTDGVLKDLFDLLVLDDRRVLVVPTDKAIQDAQTNSKSVKSSYSSTIAVTIAGQEDKPVVTKEKLTLTVKQTKPKLTAKIAPFNSFYTGQSQEIQISGGTVTGISLNEVKKNPNWLTLEKNALVLNGNTPAKSAKVYLNVETKEWAIPAAVTLSVKNSVKKPSLKLSASTVTMLKDPSLSNGIELTLKCGSKSDTLEKLNVYDITAPSGYEVSDFNQETGTFHLTPTEGFKAGKISMTVSFSDTKNVVTLPLTVKTAAVTLKRDKSSITLNRALEDKAVISITAAPADYTLELTEENLRLADKKGKTLADDSILDVTVNDNKITVATNGNTPTGTYRLYVSADGSKEVYTTVTVVNKTPTVSFKAKGTLDLSFPNNSVILNPTFKNYAGGTYDVVEWSVAEKKGKKVVNEDVTDFFDLDEESMTLFWKEDCYDVLTSGNTYEVTLKLNLPGVAEPVSGKASITMKRTSIKLKLGASSISLNKLLGDTADVSVSCATSGYDFTAPMMELWDSKGKKQLDSGEELTANGKLHVTWENGKLHIKLDEAAKYGESFQIKLKANAYSSTHTVKVTVPTEAKSKVTVTLSAKGSIDVIRSSTQIVMTPSYKNCMAGKDWDETLLVYTSADKYKTAIPAEDLFNIAEENGTYILTAKEGLNPKLKYKVKLVSTLVGLEKPVESAQTSIGVKMGSAKLTMLSNGTTLFAKDKNDRAELMFTAKDETLNQVKSIAIKDSKYKNLFEIIPYGNGEFAIGFANGTVDSSIQGKTITLNLNVFLEGNADTAATTMKLKLTVVK